MTVVTPKEHVSFICGMLVVNILVVNLHTGSTEETVPGADFSN